MVNVISNILNSYSIPYFKAKTNGYLNIEKLLEKSINATQTTTTLTKIKTTLATCPYEWSLYSGNCYKIFNNSMSFANAMNFCTKQAENSFLVQINSQEEFNWLKSFVANSKNHVWV
jgi:hypothetical protein